MTSSTTAARSAAAKRARPAYRCSECGWTTAKWVGRCGECQEWGTVTEDAPAASGPRTTAVSLSLIHLSAPTRHCARAGAVFCY